MILLIKTVIFFYLKTTLAVKSDSKDLIVNHIMRQSPNFITIVTNSFNNSENENELIKEIACGIPVFILNVKKMAVHGINQTLKTPVFNNPRDVTVYIILMNVRNIENTLSLRRMVDFFTSHLSPKPMRPKCLIIYFNKMITVKDSRFSILKYSWSQKFLDFTIINAFDAINRSTLISYDPFRKSLNFQLLSADSVIFPDKLANTNDYLFKIPFVNLPPHIKCVKLNNKNQCSGLSYRMIQIITSAMKMKIHIKNQIIEKTDKQFDLHLKSLAEGKIDISPYITSVTAFNFTGQGLEFGYILYFDEVEGIIAKHTAIISYSVILDGLIIFLIEIIILSTLIFVVNRLKWRNNSFDFFNTFRFLFGQAFLRQPKTILEKIIFLILVFVSVTYFSDNFLNVIKVEVKDYEDEIETFQDIYETKLELYANKYVAEKAFDNEDEYAKILKSKINVIADIDKCVTELVLRKKNVICLMIGLRAYMFYQKYKKDNSITLVKLKLLQTGESFIFRAASPFIEKFNKYLVKIVEAGIFQMFLTRIIKKSEDEEDFLDEFKDKENSVFSIFFLVIIAAGGCFTSCIIFFIEVFKGFKKMLHMY